MSKNVVKEEFVSDDSNESYEEIQHLPTADDENLEHEEKAYIGLEYISLDWPAQSFDLLDDSSIVLGTNPTHGMPKMLSIELEKTENLKKFEKTHMRRKNIEESYNKIRVNKNQHIYCMSDNKITIHNHSFDQIYQKNTGELGYGLCFNGNDYIYGTKAGEILVNDINNAEKARLRFHEDSVESLCYGNNLLFTASCDNSIKLIDLRNNECVNSFVYDCDINAIDYNQDNLLVSGDDAGVIRLMDIRNYQSEEIRWHKSSISCIKWKDRDVFASGSDEQVVIWDTTIEEEWEYEKYLLFVHQGQKYYKDVLFCCKDKNVVATTSIDGICLFYPLSFDYNDEI